MILKFGCYYSTEGREILVRLEFIVFLMNVKHFAAKVVNCLDVSPV